MASGSTTEGTLYAPNNGFFPLPAQCIPPQTTLGNICIGQPALSTDKSGVLGTTIFVWAGMHTPPIEVRLASARSVTCSIFRSLETFEEQLDSKKGWKTKRTHLGLTPNGLIFGSGGPTHLAFRLEDHHMHCREGLDGC